MKVAVLGWSQNAPSILLLINEWRPGQGQLWLSRKFKASLALNRALMRTVQMSFNCRRDDSDSNFDILKNKKHGTLIFTTDTERNRRNIKVTQTYIKENQRRPRDQNSRAGEMAQQVKALPCKSAAVNAIPRTQGKPGCSNSHM